MLHAGIGPAYVNALLTSINLPPVGENMLKTREREVGPAMESVAKKSCAEAIDAEKKCWIDGRQELESDTVKIGASYDMGWQERGKGHNSLTGVCIVMLTLGFYPIFFPDFLFHVIPPMPLAS